MIPDFRNVDVFTRYDWAFRNLKRYETDYVIVYEDPLYPEASAFLLSPAPEWMACALAGGIHPSIEHVHNTNFLVKTKEGKTIYCDYLEIQNIRDQENVIDERILNYEKYIKPDPIGPMTEQEAMEYLLKKDVPPRVWHPSYRHNRILYKIVKRSEIPDEEYYRDCWKLSDYENEIITIDIEKAKNVWKDKIREKRKEIFQKLDVEYFIAHEKNDQNEISRIVNHKQLLRDVTKLPEFDNVSTIEEIEKIWPEYLNN